MGGGAVQQSQSQRAQIIRVCFKAFVFLGGFFGFFFFLKVKVRLKVTKVNYPVGKSNLYIFHP